MEELDGVRFQKVKAGSHQPKFPIPTRICLFMKAYSFQTTNSLETNVIVIRVFKNTEYTVHTHYHRRWTGVTYIDDHD